MIASIRLRDRVAMLDKIRNWRDQRIAARRALAEPLWRYAVQHCAPARRLDANELARLRVLATLFLERKSIEPAQGLMLGDADRVLIATHACVPILNLGLDWYTGWRSVIVYPDAFVPRRTQVDAAGVEHVTHPALAGEAWLRGPVILSLADVHQTGQVPGRNVVIHEMAHKLDMRNGEANGFPPLPRHLDRRVWSQVFSDAWRRLHDEERQGFDLPLDPYALENPGEFFAVASETFFETPLALHTALPAVYQQLAGFYGA